MSQSFVSPFTGTVIEPTDVSYYALSFSSNTQLYWPQVANGTQVPASRIMDCTPSTTGLSIQLPDATQGSLGSDIFIRNKGASPFTVTDVNGQYGVTVNTSVVIYFYLTNNTANVNGSWGVITLGTGTSSADAASLAGAGLTVVAGQLAVSSQVTEVSANVTFNDASRAYTYVWTGGVGYYTIPSSALLSNGWWVGFRNNGSGTLTIYTTNPSLINGLSSINLNPGDSGFIYYEASTGNFFTCLLYTSPSPRD